MIDRDTQSARTSDEPMGTADIANRPEDKKSELDQRKYEDGKHVEQHDDKAKSTASLLHERDQTNGHLTSLLPEDETKEFSSRWTTIQTEFVDEPRSTLEKADSLVAELMTRLAEVFAEQRSDLEKQLDKGDQTSTEDLRLALQKYRSFFQRLLSV